MLAAEPFECMPEFGGRRNRYSIAKISAETGRQFQWFHEKLDRAVLGAQEAGRKYINVA